MPQGGLLTGGIMQPTVALIGAMPQEISLLENQMEGVSHETVAHVGITCGMLEGKNVVLALSGIGKVNAAITTTVLIERYQPDCVINTGSAGGLGKTIRIGDIVVGNKVGHHDVDVRAFGYALGQVPQLPTFFDCNSRLTELAGDAVNTTNAALHHGLIVSGDQFIHSERAVAQIRTHFPEVLACEMEAAAIAQTCVQFALPFVIIRAISDHADEKADINFETFLQTASRHSAEIVHNIIKYL